MRRWPSGLKAAHLRCALQMMKAWVQIPLYAHWDILRKMRSICSKIAAIAK